LVGGAAGRSVLAVVLLMLRELGLIAITSACGKPSVDRRDASHHSTLAAWPRVAKRAGGTLAGEGRANVGPRLTLAEPGSVVPGAHLEDASGEENEQEGGVSRAAVRRSAGARGCAHRVRRIFDCVHKRVTLQQHGPRCV
jgi:hypothetical protein